MSTHSTASSARERRFADLFAETYPAVLRFVERRIHPSHAEDIVAEVFSFSGGAWTTSRPMPRTGEPGSSASRA